MAWRAALPPAVRNTLDVVLQQPGDGRPVVFDADGTLWRGDVGEDFLRFAAANRVVRSNPEGLYGRYEALHRDDPPSAYAFAAAVFAECERDALLATAQTFFEQRFVGRVFPYVRPLLRALRSAGYDCWVCSASPSFIVEAGARSLGLEAERVIAVTNVVEGARLTSRVELPVPSGQGKVAWLKRRGVEAPVLAFGNGAIDVDMLAFAKHAIAVGPHDDETPLLREAARRAWPILRV